MLIFGANANINLLGLMIQKSFGAIFSVEVKGHFGVIQSRRTKIYENDTRLPYKWHKVYHMTPQSLQNEM